MKMKYSILSVIALLSAVLTGCSDDNDAVYLNEVQVSSSYVAIPVEGGSKTITLKASDNWEFDKVFKKTVQKEDGTKETINMETPDWLTVSQVSGGAGETEITFSAEATLDGRTAELQLSCGGQTQRINVIQGLATVSEATCAEVIAGPDSKTYMVKGTVTAIANTTYGNWYLADETGQIYIYGTLDKSGAEKNFSSLGIEVGDIVTVQGPKTTYGTTVELVNVTVVKIEKSLIKVDSLSIDDATLPLEGGDIKFYLTCKGDGVYADIPETAKDWLSIASVTGGSVPTVTFRAAPNTGGDRAATVTLKTTQKGKEYTAETTIYQKGSIIECPITDFLAAAVGDSQYRLTGIITKVVNSNYGNVNIRDYSGELFVYGIGAKGDFEKLGLKEGDIVTVLGKRGEYGGAAQMKGGVCEKSIPVTEVTIDEFLTKPDAADVYYKVTGTVDEVDKGIYGNLYLKSGDTRLYVYGCYPGWGATGDFRKNFLSTKGIAVGDELTVIGVKSTYNGTPQVNGGLYFSHKKAE